MDGSDTLCQYSAMTVVAEESAVVADTTVPSAPAFAPVADELVLADVLVEEISIDGMCGVY
jgi:mycofactocin precursor